MMRRRLRPGTHDSVNAKKSWAQGRCDSTFVGKRLGAGEPSTRVEWIGARRNGEGALSLP